MKIQKQNIILIFFLLLFQIGAQAEILESIQFQGEGCPQGSVSTTLSPDRNEVSFLFDQFIHQKPQNQISESSFMRAIRNTLSYKKCLIKIPVQIPEGYQLEEVSADLRGFVSTDKGVFHNQQLSITQMLGRRILSSSSKSQQTKSSQEQDWILSNQLKTQKYSTCRERTESILIEASSLFFGKLKQAQYLASIDSLDAKNSITFRMSRCQYDQR